MTLGTTTMTARERFARTASALLDEDPRVAVVLADISEQYFPRAARRHPDRVINVGIREQLLVSVAGGLALAGMRPVAHTYAPFLVERAFEQVKLDLGHQDVAATLVSIGASYDWAGGGRTHHAPEDVALVGSLPGWAIDVPGHPDEVPPLLRSAVAGDGRTYLRLSDQQNAVARDAGAAGPVTVRGGTRGTVLAVGPTLDPVLNATEGLDLAVAYVVRVRPFDAIALRAAVGDRPDVVLVEPYLAGTSAAEVSAALDDRPIRLLSLGVRREEQRRYGTRREHDAANELDAAGLRRRITAFLGGGASA